ncbi:helix-turn-helix domain-containing protein [Aquabacterium sp. OR-4]|uniref:helix-turn-helix domain-containing protein n=1 Tax=Aquabacterium sp. OR-4 TaxID=2978127 RepID=UPI0021B40AB2|nr:response regulator [Aquabacterium sp. OR-4]MDT7837334.1 response regulator [Aquabacterium sp. OR-4]
MSAKSVPEPEPPAHFSTIEAARRLGLAVRSVQLMVDRGELDAWKTPGGHRRISCRSVERWLAQRHPRGTPDTGLRPAPLTAAPAAPGSSAVPAAPGSPGSPSDGVPASPALATPTPTLPAPAAILVNPPTAAAARPPRVLLIEDSVHYKTLVRLLLQQQFPQIDLHVADDGIAGLALHGEIKPEVLIVDILLPGIDGAALVSSLRSHAQFARSRLIVITSLDEAQRAPYAFALAGLPVVHKPRLAVDLPPRLSDALAAASALPA